MNNYLCDDFGHKSSIRLNSLIALLVSIGLSIYAIMFDKQSASYPIIVIWVIASFVPKAIQKFAEKGV